MKKIIVSGHKGYIGSRVFFRLKILGLNPIGVERGESVPKNDVTIHCASLLNNSSETFRNNLSITNEVLLNAKKVVFTSSAGVYGNKKKPCKETDFLEPVNVYGKTKMLEERMIQEFSDEYSILRLANVYSHDADHGVVSELNKGNRVLFDKGAKTRDYVLVDDVVDVLIEAALTDKWNGIYNIGTGKRTSTKQLFDRLCPGDKPEYRTRNEIDHSCLDITKAKKNGFKPFTI